MKRLLNTTLVALATLCFTSCGDFMSGMASALGGGYGYGGYYTAPASAVTTASPFNTVPNGIYSVPATYTAPVTTSGSVNSSSSSGSGSSSSTSSGRSCGVCYGTGKCRTCNGNGTFWDSLNGNRKNCPNCTNGNCTSCGGSGRK